MDDAPSRYVLPDDVRVELDRIATRWAFLPLGRAEAYRGVLHALAQGMADEAAWLAGRPAMPLPDLGLAVLVEQVRVTAYDLCREQAQRTGNVEVARTLASYRRDLP